MGILTFLSDFGDRSPYPAAMRVVAAGTVPDGVRMIDLTHEIRPQHVCEAAFVLWSLAPECPDGTVHCAVVDPGVGTDRAGLIVATDRQTFVGPDNGLLDPAAESVGPVRVVREIDPRRTQYLRPPISSTFHGRDVFAPVAAHLASGAAPEPIGPRVDAWQSLDTDFTGGAYAPDRDAFEAQIVYVDDFGNLITNLRTREFDDHAHAQEQLVLEIDGSEHRIKRVPSFGFAERGDLCLVGGSHNRMEVSIREGSAWAELGSDIGTDLVVKRP